MQPPRARSTARARIAIIYHSAAGGTRLVAGLLGELLSAEHDVRVISVRDSSAVEEALAADFLVLCYPTYFLRPSPSTREFIERLGASPARQPAYLVTTYELYTENSLRACALLLRAVGVTVTGSAAIRAPGSDLTCVIPDWLCGWLYRFEHGLPGKLRAIARDVAEQARDVAEQARDVAEQARDDARHARAGGSERLPRWKWYTPAAQALQWAILDGFFSWRTRIRILPERCTGCGACVSRCPRGAWVKEGGQHAPHPRALRAVHRVHPPLRAERHRFSHGPCGTTVASTIATTRSSRHGHGRPCSPRNRTGIHAGGQRRAYP